MCPNECFAIVVRDILERLTDFHGGSREPSQAQGFFIDPCAAVWCSRIGPIAPLYRHGGGGGGPETFGVSFPFPFPHRGVLRSPRASGVPCPYREVLRPLGSLGTPFHIKVN